jgi:hypothetical protein
MTTVQIDEWVIDKFKKFLENENLNTDEETIKVKLNDFIELNLDLII